MSSVDANSERAMLAMMMRKEWPRMFEFITPCRLVLGTL